MKPSFLSISRWYAFVVCAGMTLLVCSCRVERPKEVLPPSKMEDVLYDYHLAQVMGGDLTGENLYKRGLYIDYVYKKHHITAAQLDSSLVWYARNPKELAAIYEHMEARTEREIEYIKQRQSQVSTRGAQPVAGDTADLWYDSRHFILTPTPLNNYHSVTIPFDGNFKKCDTIRWSFDVLFIGPLASNNLASHQTIAADANDSLLALKESEIVSPDKDHFNAHADSSSTSAVDTAATSATDTLSCSPVVARRLAVASLIVRYANDSVLAHDVVLTQNAPVDITIQNSDSVNVKSITAGVHFQSDNVTNHLVVSHNRLIRYHPLSPKDTTQIAPADTLKAATKKPASKKKSKKRDKIRQMEVE